MFNAFGLVGCETKDFENNSFYGLYQFVQIGTNILLHIIQNLKLSSDLALRTS
jgi:hypothetical protein